MNEDVFNGAMAGLVFLDGFYNEVVEEIGEEKTLGLMDKMSISLGKMQGAMLKSQARRDKIKDITPSIASSISSDAMAGMGIEIETLSETPEKATFNVKRCPVYEAAKMLGLDAEKMCRHSSIPLMETLIKQLNPNLSYELEKYRTGSDDCCRESIILTK